MRIQTTEDKTFRPFNLTITIETQEELEALLCMSVFDYSIPEYMQKNATCSLERANIVGSFLTHLNTILNTQLINRREK